MATFTTTAKPTQKLYFSKATGNDSFVNQAIDDDLTSGTWESFYVGAYVLYGGIYFNDIPSFATIRRISVYMKFKTTGKFYKVALKVVKNAKSGNSSSTDLGDGELSYLTNATASEKYYVKDFPVATSVLTADDLRNGVLQLRPYFYATSSSYKLYFYDIYVEVEYEISDVTLTAISDPAEGGVISGGGIYGYSSVATVTATANNGYIFSHWLVDGVVNSSGNTISISMTDNITVKAVFEKLTYTVRWFNEDGSLLETDITGYGDTPTYDGAIPTKPSTEKYTYTFKGWHIEVTAVTGAVDYYARYTETINKYSVLWKNDDGTILETDSTEYGVLPTYDGNTPVKASTIQYSYTFIGWDTVIEEVTRDIVYTAVYSQSVNKYHVEVLTAHGGTVTGGGMYDYGSLVTITAVPDNGYVFTGWNDNVTDISRNINVTENVSFTAYFKKLKSDSIYNGVKAVSVYCGIKKVSVYCGTKKIM